MTVIQLTLMLGNPVLSEVIDIILQIGTTISGSIKRCCELLTKVYFQATLSSATEDLRIITPITAPKSKTQT